MKKLFLSLMFLGATSWGAIGSSVQPIVTPSQVLFGSPVKTITSTGTVTISTITGTISVQNIVINGTCTGSGCGSGGGGGVSSLAVNQNGVQISSPTSAINALAPPFLISKVGGTTAQWTLDPSSVTEQGNAFSISGIAASTGTLTTSVNNLGASTGTIQTQVNAIAVSTGILSVSTTSLQTQINGLGTTYLTNSSATATYLQTSSATATYLQIPVAASTYLAQSSATATYLQSSSATLTYVQVSSLTATYLSQSSATATYFQKALILPVANGGNGTASPTMVAGTNMTSITGSWPNLTFNAATQASGGGSGNIVGLASQGSVPYYSVAGSSNTFSNFPNVSFSTTTGIIFSSTVVMGVGGYSVSMTSNTIMPGTTFYQNGTIVSGSILTQSSATATYLQLSSASLTYLYASSAPVTYLTQSSATLTYQPIGSYLTTSSATATYLQASSATATYQIKGNYLTGNQSITWTGSGDVTGSASGATSISPTLTAAANQANIKTLSASSTTITGNLEVDGWTLHKGSATVSGSGGLGVTYGITAGSAVINGVNSSTWPIGIGMSVMQSPYNAKCDGSTDDSSAFNSCLSANGQCYVPAGVSCVVTNIVMPNNTKLYGQNQSATLKQKTNFGGGNYLILFDYTSNSTIDNLTFDAAGSSQTVNSLVSAFFANNVTISNCHFTNSGTPQTSLEGLLLFQSTATIHDNYFDSTIESNQIVDDAEGPYFVNIYNNNLNGSQADAIFVKAFVETNYNVWVHDNLITNVSDSAQDVGQTGNAIGFYQVDRGKIYNNWTYNTTYSGIRLNSSNYNEVTDNHIFYADEAALWVELGAAGNIVSNNTIIHAENGIIDTNVSNRAFDTPNIINGNFVQNMTNIGIHAEHAIVTNNVIDGAPMGIDIGYGGTTHNNFVSNNKILRSSNTLTQVAIGISISSSLGIGTDTVNNNSIEVAPNAYPIIATNYSFSNEVTTVTLGANAQVKYVGTQPTNGQTVCFSAIDWSSMWQLNGQCSVVSAVTSSSFTTTLNTTGYSPFISDFLDHVSLFQVVTAVGGAPAFSIGPTVLLSNQYMTFATLGTPNHGSNVYIQDGSCNAAGALSGGGSGTFASYNGSSWTCMAVGASSGGGGSSSLAVGYGTSAGYKVLSSSPTGGEIFDQSQFLTSLPAGTTALISIAYSTDAVTGNYTATSTDTVVEANCASACTITLPTAAGISGKRFHVKIIGAGTVTIATTSSQTIDGSMSIIPNPNQWADIEIQSNGSNWDIL